MIRRKLVQVILPSLRHNLNEPEMLALAYLLLIECGADFNGNLVQFDGGQLRRLTEALDGFIYKDDASFTLLGEDDRERREDAANRTVERMEHTMLGLLRRMQLEFRAATTHEEVATNTGPGTAEDGDGHFGADVEDAAAWTATPEPTPLAPPNARVNVWHQVNNAPIQGMRMDAMWIDEQHQRNEADRQARIVEVAEQARRAGVAMELIQAFVRNNGRWDVNPFDPATTRRGE